MTKKKAESRLSLGIALIALGIIFVFGSFGARRSQSETFASEPVKVEGFSVEEAPSEKLPIKVVIPSLAIDLEVKPAKNINGYANEEFTHVAVAAMIASGAADTGFGIAAAAEQFNLDFIPYLQEAYVLALDMGLNPILQSAIRKHLQSVKFREHINTLAGYNASESGQEISFQELLGGA